MNSSQRPLSPHLQVYKPQLTSLLSITHRLTGLMLSLGLVIFSAWLYCVVKAPDTANQMALFFASGFGQVLLFAWVFAFNYHLCNGIRHLFWDAGKGYDIPTLYKTGYLVLVMALVLTAVMYYVGRLA